MVGRLFVLFCGGEARSFGRCFVLLVGEARSFGRCFVLLMFRCPAITILDLQCSDYLRFFMMFQSPAIMILDLRSGGYFS